MKNLFSKMLALTLVAFLLLAMVPASQHSEQAAIPEGKGFSIVSMQPDVIQALRAQGKKINYPTPATANKGKKFNPGAIKSEH